MNDLREKTVAKITEQQFDLLVIGGGITGAGIALDAASRGLKVICIDKNDFGWGTSSRSTKLVHGGLRYLKNGEFNMVRKVGRERAIVYKNAPHIVTPQRMILPMQRKGTFSPWLTKIALTIYDLLAGVYKHERNYKMTTDEVVKAEPLINKNELLGGVAYYEYKCDDSRLVIETLKKAVEYGAIVLNYCELKKWTYNNNAISGGECLDRISNKQLNIVATKTVNATGPWVDDMRLTEPTTVKKHLHLTKGVHLVFSKIDLPITNALYFDVADGRMIFAIPKRHVVYVGTTDTTYSHNIDNPLVSENDITYLCNAVNNRFNVELKKDDVIYAWAGLRPLIFKSGKNNPSELSRKDEIFTSETGLLSIAGGKLTGYRLMAKEIVDKIEKELSKTEKRNFVKCSTKNIKLSGGNFDGEIDTDNLIYINDIKYDEAKQTGVEVQYFKELFYRYGSNIDEITNKAYELKKPGNNWKDTWLEAEIWYSVNYEFTISAFDFLIRRTSIPLFNPELISDDFITKVNSLFVKYLLNYKETVQELKNKISLQSVLLKVE